MQELCCVCFTFFYTYLIRKFVNLKRNRQKMVKKSVGFSLLSKVTLSDILSWEFWYLTFANNHNHLVLLPTTKHAQYIIVQSYLYRCALSTHTARWHAFTVRINFSIFIRCCLLCSMYLIWLLNFSENIIIISYERNVLFAFVISLFCVSICVDKCLALIEGKSNICPHIECIVWFAGKASNTKNW